VEEESSEAAPSHFIRNIVAEDCKEGKHQGRVHTRFPPEPNGYLHIGHAKSICLNFGLAAEFGGLCNLRFDDTNPSKEEVEYVESIKEDVRWLGFDWGDREFYASDYFEQLYQFALQLIKSCKAYVCDLDADQMREYRGTLTEPGKNSPYRDRSVDENLGLFQRMRAGEFADGSRTLRAKIDMASPNINMRDPVMYRVLRSTHHRTGDRWCIYPTYDFAHGQSDSIEGSPIRLHARIRGPPPTLRLVSRSVKYSSPAADRIRPLEPYLHGSEQTKVAPARKRRPCGRLGRPAHADHRRYSQARLHAGGDPQLLRTHRRG
jgi:glutaminyl-tRNA synthetase